VERETKHPLIELLLMGPFDLTDTFVVASTSNIPDSDSSIMVSTYEMGAIILED